MLMNKTDNDQNSYNVSVGMTDSGFRVQRFSPSRRIDWIYGPEMSDWLFIK